jgi:hypothetical protein
MFSGIAFVLLGVATATTPCENLTTLKLTNATITSAAVVPEGPPPAPARGAGGAGARGGRGGGAPRGPVAPPANIPAHCRVQIV